MMDELKTLVERFESAAASLDRNSAEATYLHSHKPHVREAIKRNIEYMSLLDALSNNLKISSKDAGNFTRLSNMLRQENMELMTAKASPRTYRSLAGIKEHYSINETDPESKESQRLAYGEHAAEILAEQNVVLALLENYSTAA